MHQQAPAKADPLLTAVHANDLKTVRHLLKSGVNLVSHGVEPNARDTNGDTALINCVSWQIIDAVFVGLSKAGVKRCVQILASSILSKLPEVTPNNPEGIGVAEIIRSRCKHTIDMFEDQ